MAEENSNRTGNAPVLDEARANGFYDMLVKTKRMDEKNREETLRRIQDPSRMEDFYDFLVKKKGFKEGNREETMRRLYPGLHGVLPYADKRPEAGFESPVSMDKLPGLIRERQEQESLRKEKGQDSPSALSYAGLTGQDEGWQASEWFRQAVDREISRREEAGLSNGWLLPGQRQAVRNAAEGMRQLNRLDAGDDMVSRERRIARTQSEVASLSTAYDAIEKEYDDMRGMMGNDRSLEDIYETVMMNHKSGTPNPLTPLFLDKEGRFEEMLTPDQIRERIGSEIGKVKKQRDEARNELKSVMAENLKDRSYNLKTMLVAADHIRQGETEWNAFNAAYRYDEDVAPFYGQLGKDAQWESLSEEMTPEAYRFIMDNKDVLVDAVKNLDESYERLMRDEDASAFRRFVQGMQDSFDMESLLTLGISDIAEAVKARNIAKRVAEGKGSDADRAYMEAFSDKMEAAGLYDGGTAYAVGQGFYESMIFMLDMAITGGLAAGLRKGATKGAVKLIGRKTAQEAARASTRLGKAAGTAADWMVGAALSPQTWQGMEERQMQNYMYGRDGNGDFVAYVVTDPESPFRSFANAWGSNLISRFVERGVGPILSKGSSKVFSFMGKSTQRWTPSYLNHIRRMAPEMIGRVEDAISLQGLGSEFLEEIVEQPLQYWLIEMTAREKELGAEKAWSDVYGDGFFPETLLTCATIQAVFGTPGVVAGTAAMIDNHAMMRKHLSRLDEATVKKLRGVMALEDDNARAQGLAGLLRDAGTDQQRMDILGYAVSRAASNMGLSWQRAEAQGRETEAYRQTLMAASSDGTTVTTAQDKDGNTFAVRAVEGDSYALAYPVSDNGDGTVSLGAPVQRSMSDFDKGSMASAPLETYLQGLSARQRAQGQAEDAAAREQDMAASLPPIRADRPMQAVRPVTYFTTDMKKEKAAVEGSRIEAVADVPEGTAADAPVRVVVTAPNGKAEPGVMTYGQLQGMLADGTAMESEPVRRDPEHRVSVSGAAQGQQPLQDAQPSPQGTGESGAQAGTGTVSGQQPGEVNRPAQAQPAVQGQGGVAAIPDGSTAMPQGQAQPGGVAQGGEAAVPAAQAVQATAQPNVREDGMPLDEAGEPAYEQAPVQATWDDLMAQNGNDEKEALVTVQAMIENREAELESAQKEIGKKPKGKTVAEIQRSKAERKRKAEEASAKLDYWRKVAAWPEEKRKAEEHARKMNERNKRSLAAQKSQGMPFSKRHAELGDAVSFREDFLRRLATGGVQISEETVRSMGMTKQDLAGFNRQYPPLVPKEGGKSIEQLADDLWSDIEGDSDKAATYWDARSREDVESVIRDVFGSVSSKKGAMEEAERLHGETLEEQQRKELEAAGIDPDAVPEAGTDESLEGQADTPEARKARLEERHRQRQEADAETRAWMEEMGLLNGEEPPFHRSGERGAEAPTEAEAELRDAIVGRLRESGIEVVEDSEAGQRVLDEANGKNVMLNARKKKSLETDSVPQEEHQRTVISSDDGAKVLNNLDDLIKEYENSVHTKEKTFIGNAAKALGAKRYGSKSEYATFETVNGNEVTIRLSDHNASVERMDKAGRDNAISIVVTPKPNSGILDDGNAHIVEFYYNAIRLRRAEGKPLVEILKSIKQALYSGEFKDTTGLAEVKVVNADRIRYHRGYHGSGADFESFDHSHMGEGEGAQAYGWGSYVTEVEGIGRAYAESSSRDKRENATVYKRRQIRDNETSINVIQGMIAEYPERQREREKRLAELEKELAGQNGQKDRIEKESGRDSVAYRNFMFYAEDIIKDTERNIARIKNDIRDEAEYNEQRKRQVSELEEENKRLQSEIEAIEAQYPRHLYTVEIPDDTGKNYLAWEKPVPDGVDREKLWDFTLGAALSKGEHDETEREMLSGDIRDSINDAETGKDLYKAIGLYIGDREASSLLHDMGYTGISYPAEYRSGGRSDGARNYVIFKESDLKITDHARFFRTPGGEAYGFTVGGKIYLDPRIAKADTPIHEYAHLWASALREGNPEEWANVAGLMKDTPVWEEVKRLYPELETDEEIADEVLATYSGRRGAERLREAMREAGKEDGLGGRLAAMEAVGRVREALQRFWHAVADFLHIRYTTAEEVADRVLSDLLAGVNPGAFSAMNNDIRFSRTGNMKEDAEAFAGKHNLNVSDVTDYADYMAQGNLMGANRAFNEMRRKIRVDNTGMNLREFVKVFAPVREELYAKYGNLDELQSEYERKAEEDRSVMEAAKKRAEAEAEAEQRRLQGFRDMTDETLDAEYVKAVEANDENRMRDLVDEAARRKGYGDTRSEYQGTGAWVAPSNPGYETDAERRESFREDGGDVNVTDIAEGYSMQPEDYFTNPRGYGNDTPHGRESAKAINEALKEIREGNNPKIKIYRAVPKTVKEGKVRNGDWVTPSRIYAEMHGNSRLEGDYRIIEQEVPANNLWWDGNDVNEWGYDDGKEYAYRNTRNNRKLNDLVTRDDQGNIIPLSKRFDYRKGDPRFRQQGGRGDATDMESKRAAVESLGRKLNVEVVFEDEASLRKQPRQYRTASGWFDRAQWRKDGRRVIHVNLSNTGDAHEAEMTVLHEAVGHMGLRELLGAENYDPFLDMVHGIIPEAQSGRLRALVFKGHPDLARRVGEGNADAKDREAAEAELRRVMADEWLAELAEVGGEPGVWEQIVESFRMLLRRLGFELSLSEADIRALLFESRRNLESSRLPGEAERIREQQEEFREAARLDRIMEADMADMEADAGSEASSFRQWYGGNSGYVGYSMSRRAAEAREEGRFPKTDFKKEYHVSEHALKALVRTGFIDGSEWHHTSKYGNRTPFYGWTDEASAQTYLDNKKEVDALSKEYDGLGPDNNADLFLEERMSSMRKERGYGMDFLTDGEKTERSRRLDEIGIADFGMDEAERARINAASEAVIDEYRELSGRRIREMESEIQGMDEYKNLVEEEGRKEARRKEIEGRLEEIFGQQETGPDGVLFRQGGGASARPTRSQRRQAERMFRDDKIISAGKEREWTSRQRFRHGMANLQEFFNDSVRLRYLGNHIRRMGGRVSSATDLYELATTVPAKEQYRSERFELSCGRPLVSCVREILQKTGKKVRDLELYMIAKHGPERNRWMYNRKKLGELADDMAYEVRNESGITRPLGEAAKNRIIASIMKEYGGTDSYMDAAVARKMAADIYEALSKSHAASMMQEAMKAQGKGLSLPKDNASILTQENLDGIAEKTQSSLLERAKKDTDKDKDFSGLSDFAKTTGTNPENYVARFEEEVEAAVPGGIDSFWAHLNAVTDFTLQTRLECGLMSEEAYQAIKDMGWSHYVPLRSWEEREEESLAYLDMEYPEMMDSGKTRKLYPKKAKGRHSLSAGPMGYIFQAAETAMKEGEKNLYLQAVGRLARENSGFTHLWTVSNAESAEAQRAEAMTLEEIHKTETGREAESHRVLYRVNGEYRYVDFVNPRMAAAVRGDRAMKWDRIWAGKLLKPLRNMTRLMSMLNTSLSSAFAIRNAIRDLQFAINSRIIEDGKRPVASGFIFIWNWMMSLPAAFRSTNDEWVMTSGSKQAGLVRLWKENGGETGWHTLKPLNELKRKIVRDMERGELAQRAKDKIEALPRMLQYTAEVLENSVRLAAFKDAMQRGKDAQEAAFYSKEVTTNFNRRSRMANVGGPVYMFLNASIQGLVRYAELFRKAPKAFLGFNAFMFLLGDMVSAMAAAGDDDDGEREYLKMSRYLRYTNWVVGHWTIPLAHGFKLPYGLGAAWREFQLGNMNEGELAVEVMHLFGNELLPGPLNLTTAINYDPSRMEMNLKEGGDYFIDLAPSPLVWYAEVQTNRDFMGNPIKRELYTKDQRDDVAEVARYMPNTNPMLLHFDEKIAGIGGYVPELDQKFTINKRLNGQLSWWLDWNPNSQEHMISSLFGSAGRGFMDITRLAGKIYNGEAITERDIPVLNKLYRSTDPEKSILMEYYRLHDYCEFYLKATSKSSKDVALPLISDESRNVALKRMEGLLSDEQYAVVLTFDEYRKKVDELLAMETQLRGYKQDSGALKEVRLEVQALANKLKLDLFKARDPERYQRMIDYNSIRDNDLRGFAAYMEMLKQQRKRRKAKVED